MECHQAVSSEAFSVTVAEAGVRHGEAVGPDIPPMSVQRPLSASHIITWSFQAGILV